MAISTHIACNEASCLLFDCKLFDFLKISIIRNKAFKKLVNVCVMRLVAYYLIVNNLIFEKLV